MDTALFNIFDLPMVLAIFVSLIIASVLMVSRPRTDRHLLLAVYLYAIACVELDKVIFWSMPVHRLFEPVIPLLFTFGKWISLLIPVLLYGFIRSAYSGKALFKTDARWAFIPVTGALLAFYLYQSLGSDVKQYVPTNYREIFSNNYFQSLLLFKYTIFFMSALLCIRIYNSHQMHNRKKHEGTDVSKRELQIILIGALITNGVEFIADVLAALKSNDLLLNGLGILHNYVVLLYVCSILVYMLKENLFKPSVKSKKISILVDKENEIDKVHQLMINHKYYLDPEVTLEKLATKLNIPEYQLSHLLNKNFSKTFFDFINYYRTEHAKELISGSTSKTCSMLDILYDSGFNSKSAFNRCFKKYTGITPSEYRDKLRAIS